MSRASIEFLTEVQIITMKHLLFMLLGRSSEVLSIYADFRTCHEECGGRCECPIYDHLSIQTHMLS